MKNILKLIACIAVCQIAGMLGAFFTIQSVTTWYPVLIKPVYNPPNWIFAPVWTVLYLMMALSAYLVWKKGFGIQAVRGALLVFLLQLLLNGLWSAVFFGLRSVEGGLIVIIFLLSSIIWTILRFRAISKPAAALLIPYVGWVCFAAFLNAAIVSLNK